MKLFLCLCLNCYLKTHNEVGVVLCGLLVLVSFFLFADVLWSHWLDETSCKLDHRHIWVFFQFKGVEDSGSKSFVLHLTAGLPMLAKVPSQKRPEMVEFGEIAEE